MGDQGEFLDFLFLLTRCFWLNVSVCKRIRHIFYINCLIPCHTLVGWLLGFYDSTRDKDDTTVGVGHSRRYCNTGYNQSQGRRPSTLKCFGPISKGDIEPNHPSEINPNSDSRSRSDGRSRRFVQYRVDQSQGQRPRSLLSDFSDFECHTLNLYNLLYSVDWKKERCLIGSVFA